MGVWNTGYIIYITINIYLFIYYLIICIFCLLLMIHIEQFKNQKIYVFSLVLQVCLKGQKWFWMPFLTLTMKHFMTRVSNTRVQIEIAFFIINIIIYQVSICSAIDTVCSQKIFSNMISVIPFIKDVKYYSPHKVMSFS